MANSSTNNKSNLHPRSKHRGLYDFNQLIEAIPSLATFVKKTNHGNDSIDFFDPNAVIALNKALLKQHYHIENWSIPTNFLCPPIPGRADYIHHAADLLDKGNGVPTGTDIKCLDIGVGASCIYPILGVTTYGWTFVASDIDKVALTSSQKIIDNNIPLKGKIDLRLQQKSNQILKGILKKNESIDLIICNPPFHSSAAEANAVAQKKASNLLKKKTKNPVLNFGGQQNELWCSGGEYQFVKTLIYESKQFSKSCNWFTSLISKKSTLKHMYAELNKVGATEIKTIEMNTGNKSSRILCWSF